MGFDASPLPQTVERSAQQAADSDEVVCILNQAVDALSVYHHQDWDSEECPEDNHGALAGTEHRIHACGDPRGDVALYTDEDGGTDTSGRVLNRPRRGLSPACS